jgi:hypothetical protein
VTDAVIAEYIANQSHDRDDDFKVEGSGRLPSPPLRAGSWSRRVAGTGLSVRYTDASAFEAVEYSLREPQDRFGARYEDDFSRRDITRRLRNHCL